MARPNNESTVMVVGLTSVTVRPGRSSRPGRSRRRPETAAGPGLPGATRATQPRLTGRGLRWGRRARCRGDGLTGRLRRRAVAGCSGGDTIAACGQTARDNRCRRGSHAQRTPPTSAARGLCRGRRSAEILLRSWVPVVHLALSFLTLRERDGPTLSLVGPPLAGGQNAPPPCEITWNSLRARQVAF